MIILNSIAKKLLGIGLIFLLASCLDPAQNSQQTTSKTPQKAALNENQLEIKDLSVEKKKLDFVAQGNCKDLSQTDCLNSEQCMLEQDDKKQYICRAAKNDCELGFSQMGNNQAACNDKQGCQYKSESCFCPPGVTCICGGGKPPSCVEQKSASF